MQCCLRPFDQRFVLDASTGGLDVFGNLTHDIMIPSTPELNWLLEATQLKGLDFYYLFCLILRGIDIFISICVYLVKMFA